MSKKKDKVTWKNIDEDKLERLHEEVIKFLESREAGSLLTFMIVVQRQVSNMYQLHQ